MKRTASYTPYPLPHELAADGAPDKYILTKPVSFSWDNAPASLAAQLPIGILPIYDSKRVKRGYIGHSYCLGIHELTLTIYTPFYFAVSVAPSFPRARPGACLHDFIYAFAEMIAAALNISVREVLHIADRWFLAQMTASGFLLKRTYYIFVRLFGYYFHKLCSNSQAAIARIINP